LNSNEKLDKDLRLNSGTERIDGQEAQFIGLGLRLYFFKARHVDDDPLIALGSRHGCLNNMLTYDVKRQKYTRAWVHS
jgi:hypothetical protein